MLIDSLPGGDAGYPGTFENMLRASVASGVFTADAQGNITALTTEAERLLNLSSAKPPLKLEHLPAVLQHIIREVQSSGQGVTNRTITISPAQAEPVSLVVNAVRTARAVPPGVVISVKAVPSMENLERNLRRLDRLASLGTLSASMAHEIKNALVAVRTFTELLLEKSPDADLGGIVRREISRVDSIVSKMLRFSAPAQPQLSQVKIHKLLDHTLRLVQHGSGNKQISFQSDFKAEADSFSGDDHQLEQAFVNLLFNAVEAIPGEGSLTVSTDLIADESRAELREGSSSRLLRIRITDTGIGIPADKLKSIFDPFFTTKQNGTGLGLAITQRIIEEHNGSIEVESSGTQGTTFTVLLPASNKGYSA